MLSIRIFRARSVSRTQPHQLSLARKPAPASAGHATLMCTPTPHHPRPEVFMLPFASARRIRSTASLLALMAASAFAQDGTVPAAWEGVWDTHIEVRICGMTNVVFEESFDDTLCEGDVLYADEGSNGNCSGTITDTSADWTCVFSEEPEAGCTMTLTIHLSGTRSGDSFTAVETYETVYTGSCSPEFQDSCLEFTTTATRTGETPQCDQVGQSVSSWSSVKSKFH
jgi:hypothetical protein